MRWEGQVFIDGVLPFGLQSAPLIFTALADAFEWVLKQEGTRWIFHYIDDFITIVEPDSEECALNMVRIERIPNEVGLPIAEKKTEGPSACLTFLGIELDTRVMEIRKITRQQVNPVETSTIRLAGKEGSQEERTSVTDWHLSHACKVIRSGRTFLRRLITLSIGAKRLDHFIRLSRCARSDIEWWHTYSKGWNGISMMSVVEKTNPKVSLTTDASGSWGCGEFPSNQ